MMKELKGTRDQRVKVWENSQHSFLGFLRLLSEQEARDKIGREAELFRVAMEREYDRLSAAHIYEDKTVDQPLLTAENVLD
jgi:hypothetical protein